jgi:hypothetical protein
MIPSANITLLFFRILSDALNVAATMPRRLMNIIALLKAERDKAAQQVNAD